MIPQRVALRGFLCYRDDEVIDFTGSTLWMLAGLNGSGKSAVFDAVTFALFGWHRGGAQNAAELINKDSDGFEVAFEFLHDDVPYRIRRTLKKTAKTTSATQQVARLDGGKWAPIPETGKRKEFDAWVAENLGLTYETFTSSVLLLQGRAEKLLDSTARGRFEVLAGIVDLDRYARLHARTDDRRKSLKAKLETVRAQLEAVPPVGDDEFAAARARIDEAEAGREQAVAEVERWRDVEFQAKRYAELHQRADAQRQRAREAKGLIAGADAIDRDAARFRELTAVVPRAVEVIKFRGQHDEAVREATTLKSHALTIAEKLLECESAAEQAVRKRTSLQADLARGDNRSRELTELLRALTARVAQVDRLDGQREALARLETEFARLPADLDRQVEDAQREGDDLATLAAVVPVLARLHQSRGEFRAALDAERRAAESEQSIRTLGEKLAAELERLAPDLKSRGEARQQADEAASAAQALLRQAKEEVESFRRLEGARVCRSCGQELTPQHFDRELAKRVEDVRVAETEAKKTAAARSAARAAEDELRRTVEALGRERHEKRDSYIGATGQRKAARQQADRLARDCAAAHAELPAPFRDRIADGMSPDWAATDYPAADELAALRQQAAGVDAARRRVRELQKDYATWTTLRYQVAEAKRAADATAAGIGGDPATIRQDHVGAQAEESALAKTQLARKNELKAVEAERERLAGERERWLAEKATVASKSAALESTRLHTDAALRAAREALPPAWHAQVERAKLSDQHDWKTELEALAAANVEQKADQLRQARAEVAGLERDRDALAHELEQFPDEAKLGADAIRERLLAARKAVNDREEALREARAALGRLDDRRDHRLALEAQERDADRDHARTATLAELLGPRRLQLYLVRRAERQIVEHANAVLDRLSGGQLFLRLCAGDDGEVSEKALELEVVNRTTGDSPINVAFLSGSQRFRVAVSLALGIGQYASRQHRPIESVIIDEGFGCLDRNGRQVMIQELQNLRGHLKCILLVSHQEEFAEAFSDGYRFELEDGTTRVTRVQK